MQESRHDLCGQENCVNRIFIKVNLFREDIDFLRIPDTFERFLPFVLPR